MQERWRRRTRRAAGWLALLVVISTGPGCTWNKAMQAEMPPEADRPDRAVLLMFFDGVAVEKLDQLREAGRLPNMSDYLFDRGVRVDHAVSVIPSITFAVNASLATGQFPGHHNITGNRWFDRDRLELEDYDGMVSYLRVNQGYSRPTLFEMVPDLYSVTVLTPVHRGSTRHFANWLSTGVTWFFGTMEQVDALTVYRMNEIARESRAVGRWPDIIWTYFPGPDTVGHRYGKDSPQYEASLLNADVQVGRLVTALKQAAMLERTLMVLVSDHGHVVIDPEQHVNMYAVLTREFGFEVAYKLKVGGTYRERYATFGADRVAMTDEGNRRAVLHLRVGDDWRVRPTLAQIERFHRDYGSQAVRDDPAPFWQVLLGAIRPASRLAAVRDGDHRALVTDGTGAGLVERRVESDNGRVGWPLRTAAESFRYRVLQPPDPLQLGERPESDRVLDGQFHSSQQWLRATCGSRFPDFVAQIVDYFDAPRAGDVMVFSADGWDFSRHNLGGHGGAGTQDMLVPMVFAGPGLPAGGHIPAARVVDVMPTLLEFLGRLDALRDRGPIDGVSRLTLMRQAAAPPATQKAGE